jgi:hypothetical protein
MKNAYECTEEFTKDGQCLRRTRKFGPILVTGVVALVAIIFGHAVIPASFWRMLVP